MLAGPCYRASRRLSALALAAGFIAGAAPLAHAAHPLATEDAATQGQGKFELEIGWQRARDEGTRAMELGAQLSYGVVDTLDVIVRPTVLDLRTDEPSGSGAVRGVGDTSLGFKWRFRDAHPLSAAVRADVFLPTGSVGRGLGSGEPSYHVVLAVSAPVGEAWHVHGNVGYDRVPRSETVRQDVPGVSAAAVWSASKGLHISTELIATGPLDRESSRWSLATRFGLIATVVDGFDLDVGWQTRINHVGPQAIALAGAAIRW